MELALFFSECMIKSNAILTSLGFNPHLILGIFGKASYVAGSFLVACIIRANLVFLKPENASLALVYVCEVKVALLWGY